MAQNAISATNTISDAPTVNTDFSKVKFSVKKKPQPEGWKATEKFPLWCAYHGPAGHVAEGCKKAAEKKANIKAEEKKLGDAAERRKIQKRFVDKWLAIARKMNREKARKRKEKAAVKAAEKAAKSSE